MSDHDTDLVRTYFQRAWHAGDLEWAESHLDPAYVLHRPDGSVLRGFPVWRAGVQYLRTAFPDIRFDHHLVVAAGDLVAVHSTLTATHRGDYCGVPATGRPVRANNADFYRVRDGRLAEHWDVVDQLTILRQIGASDEVLRGTRDPA